MKSYLLITGATGGLGSAFAIDCARRGYDLFLTDIHPEGSGFASYLADTFRIDVKYKPCDLASSQSRQDFYNALKAEGYRFWGLINVAGTDHEGSFLERTRQQVLAILRVNVEATLDTTHAILKIRDPQRRFTLINVCSLAAYYPMPYKAVYAATKRLLLDFTLAIAEEIQSFGNATALCPAGLPTNPEVMRAIFAQGFWGKATAMEPETVAHKTMDYALKGKRVYIPGLINQFIQGLGSLVPVSLITKWVGRRWKTAQNSTTMWNFTQVPRVAERTEE